MRERLGMGSLSGTLPTLRPTMSPELSPRGERGGGEGSCCVSARPSGGGGVEALRQSLRLPPHPHLMLSLAPALVSRVGQLGSKMQQVGGGEGEEGEMRWGGGSRGGIGGL